MNRRQSVLLTWLSLIVVSWCSAPAFSQDVLSVIPDNALGFIVVPRIADADAKIAEVARLIQVPAPGVLAMAKLSAGIKEGLDEQGSLALTFVAGAGDEAIPVPFLFVPTTNYDKLIKQFEPEDAGEGISQISIAGQASLVGKKGKFAVVAPTGMEDQLKAALASEKSVAANAAAFKSLVAEGDVSLVITTAGVKLGSKKALEGLAMAKGFLASAGPDAQAAVVGIEVYENLFKAIEKSVTHFGLSLRMDMDGTCHLASQTLLDSQMQDVKTEAVVDATGKDALATIPGDGYVIAFQGSMSGGFSESMMKMSAQMVKNFPGGEKVTDEQIKKIVDTSMKAMKDIKSMAASIGVGKPADPLYSNMVLTMTVDDSKAYLENYEKVMNTMRELGQAADIPLYKFDKPEWVEVDGLSALKITMDIPNTAGPAAEEMMKEMMKKMFGEDGRMVFYLAAVNKTTVAGAYVTPDALSRLAKVAKNRDLSLAADADVAKTKALLPAGSQWVVYINLKGAFEFANNMATLFAPPDAGIVIPPFPATQPIGFAAKTSLTKIETDLVVPGAVLKAIGDYAKQFRPAQDF